MHGQGYLVTASIAQIVYSSDSCTAVLIERHNDCLLACKSYQKKRRSEIVSDILLLRTVAIIMILSRAVFVSS